MQFLNLLVLFASTSYAVTVSAIPYGSTGVQYYDTTSSNLVTDMRNHLKIRVLAESKEDKIKQAKASVITLSKALEATKISNEEYSRLMKGVYEGQIQGPVRMYQLALMKDLVAHLWKIPEHRGALEAGEILRWWSGEIFEVLNV
ncbi:hypothetical protein BC835DRAFT_1393746 [Cytidiella melzeri]|nr:hypothetical protein BC835DRAFT_1393746 [Cytidiella melzeri]